MKAGRASVGVMGHSTSAMGAAWSRHLPALSPPMMSRASVASSTSSACFTSGCIGHGSPNRSAMACSTATSAAL